MQGIKGCIKREPKEYILEALQFYKQKSEVSVAIIFILLIAINFSGLFLSQWVYDAYFASFNTVDFSSTVEIADAYKKVAENMMNNPSVLIGFFIISAVTFFISIFAAYCYSVISLKSYRNPLDQTKEKYFSVGKIVKFFIAYIMYTILYRLAEGLIFPIYFVMLYLIMYIPFIIDKNNGIIQSFKGSKDYLKKGGYGYARVMIIFFTVVLLSIAIEYLVTFTVSNIYVSSFISSFVSTIIALASIKLSVLIYYDIKFADSIEERQEVEESV